MTLNTIFSAVLGTLKRAQEGPAGWGGGGEGWIMWLERRGCDQGLDEYCDGDLKVCVDESLMDAETKPEATTLGPLHTRTVATKLWEPKRKHPKIVPTHLRNHVVRSRILECNVKSHVPGPNQILFQWISIHTNLTHDRNKINQRSWVLGVPWPPNGFVC